MIRASSKAEPSDPLVPPGSLSLSPVLARTRQPASPGQNRGRRLMQPLQTEGTARSTIILRDLGVVCRHRRVGPSGRRQGHCRLFDSELARPRPLRWAGTTRCLFLPTDRRKQMAEAHAPRDLLSSTFSHRNRPLSQLERLHFSS